MNISFEGIGQQGVTFAVSGEVKKGEPVKISANGIVSKCSAGDAFIGAAVNAADGGAVNVIMKGFMTLAYSGTAPALGYAALGADGNGGVKTVATGGRTVLVVEVNETDTMVCVCI